MGNPYETIFGPNPQVIEVTLKLDPEQMQSLVDLARAVPLYTPDPEVADNVTDVLRQGAIALQAVNTERRWVIAHLAELTNGAAVPTLSQVIDDLEARWGL